MRPRIAALVATTVLGLVVGLTSPAYADKYAGEDAAGDVVTFDEDFVEGLAPDHTDTDVVKAVVRHGRSRVALRLRVRDLHRVQQKDSLSNLHGGMDESWLVERRLSEVRILNLRRHHEIFGQAPRHGALPWRAPHRKCSRRLGQAFGATQLSGQPSMGQGRPLHRVHQRSRYLL